MITKETWQEIINAVERPSEYRKGAFRKKLRAAVEVAIEAATNSIVGVDTRSPEQMTRDLNIWVGTHKRSAKRRLAAAVLGVIEGFDVLRSSSYDDEEDEFDEFIDSSLRTLINLIKYES